MKVYGLIGYPLEHSFSLNYFTEKFNREDLADCVFRNFPVQNIQELPALVKSTPDLSGVAVTIPYKQSVLPYLDQIDEEAKAAGAVNCICIRNGKLIGYNTDIVGFLRSFSALRKKNQEKAIILGSGGASLAVRFVLKSLGMEYLMVSRHPQAGESIGYRQMNAALMASHRVIINCTPAGMFPQTDTFPDIPYDHISSEHYLFDLVYNPTETLFLQKGKERGAFTQNGWDMLRIQAEENWKLWNSPG
jgi:shikimate dehydrogenase